MNSSTTPLSVDLLQLDADTQNRESISEDVVQDYAELIEAAHPEWPLGPLDVFHDGEEYFLADGFHRTRAAQLAKRGSIPCRIHEGTADDARIFNMTANDKHGLRMTRADKKRCVVYLLDNHPELTQQEMAEKAGVSLRTVARIVADRNPVSVANVPMAHEPPSRGDERLNEIAERVNALGRESLTGALQVGEHLQAAKALVPDEDWDAVCEQLFEGSLEEANLYIKLVGTMASVPEDQQVAMWLEALMSTRFVNETLGNVLKDIA